jgi:hypothetical protein
MMRVMMMATISIMSVAKIKGVNNNNNKKMLYRWIVDIYKVER